MTEQNDRAEDQPVEQETPGAEATSPAAEPEVEVEVQVDSAPAAADGEVAALRDRMLRLAAEFDNFRKRTERERAEIASRAQAEIVRALLDPLDDLQRIADFDPATNSAQSLHEGAEMVERKFLRVMETSGLEIVDAQDQRFDPTVHEALTTVPAASADQDDTVAQVYRKGYRFRGVLVRPAQVVVRKFNG